MAHFRLVVPVVAAFVLMSAQVVARQTPGTQLAELVALKGKVGNAETRVRVAALHRVWTIALASDDSEIKHMALGLLEQPVGSSSDHIRMPAVYAIAEIANSTDDVRVKTRAVTALREPLQASQVPIRDVAIDAVNSIAASTNDGSLALAALAALAPAVKSGNNGVRIPAINAVMRAVVPGRNDQACQTALDLLVAPLDSNAAIGGMEVRMMAVVAVERIGLAAPTTGTKAKAMGLLQAYASRKGWEPEAQSRAQEAASAIQNSIK